MKKTFLSLTLIISINVTYLQSQDYIPMDTITDWKIEAAFIGSWNYWYTYTGDTTINGQDYRIILSDEYEFLPIYHYFREDHIERKVYKYLPDENAEILYYDFSLEIGDDFYVDFSDAIFTVYNIDTVYSEIGPLRRWWLENGFLYFTYTEAIGGDVPDYQYWIYVADPTHYVVCAFNYCSTIYSQEECDLSPYRVDTTLLSETACDGDEYVLPDGSITTVHGSYGPYTIQSANGCDSIVYLELIFVPLDIGYIDTVLCDGDPYTGPYTYYFINQYGCDSIIVVLITYDPTVHVLESYELCPGEEVYGFSEPGEYTLTLPSKEGCDTMLILWITQLPEGHPSCITAIDDPLFPGFKIFPNPAADHLTVETENASVLLEILDYSGAVIMREMRLSQGLNSIDIHHLLPGGYLIKLMSDDRTVYNKLMKL